MTTFLGSEWADHHTIFSVIRSPRLADSIYSENERDEAVKGVAIEKFIQNELSNIFDPDRAMNSLSQEEKSSLENAITIYINKYCRDFRESLGAPFQPVRNEQRPALALEVEVPEGISEEKMLKWLTEGTVLADQLHRSLGGAGLEIKGVHITQDAPVQEFA